MADIESKLHGAGIVIYRIKGDLKADDVETWRNRLSSFIKDHEKIGVCGVLVDVGELESLSIEATDSVIELLSDPEEAIKDVKMRFAFVGVRPFTQRFLHAVMPLEEVKHVRARFFHEVSEAEALAWLQAMVSSAADVALQKKEEATTAKAGSVTEKLVSKAQTDGGGKAPVKAMAELLKGREKSPPPKEAKAKEDLPVKKPGS